MQLIINNPMWTTYLSSVFFKKSNLLQILSFTHLFTSLFILPSSRDLLLADIQMTKIDNKRGEKSILGFLNLQMFPVEVFIFL